MGFCCINYISLNHEVGQTEPFSCFVLSYTLLPIASLERFGFDELLHPKHSKGPNTAHLAQKPGTKGTSSLCAAMVPGMVNTMLQPG